MDPVAEVKRATKGKRFAAALVDLLLIPLVAGIVLGLLFVAVKADEAVRMIIMVAFNVAWLIIRDAVGSPGRAMVGIRLQKTDGTPVGVGTALARNIHLMIPLVLLVGYLVEFIALLATGERLADRWAHTIVVEK